MGRRPFRVLQRASPMIRAECSKLAVAENVIAEVLDSCRSRLVQFLIVNTVRKAQALYRTLRPLLPRGLHLLVQPVCLHPPPGEGAEGHRTLEGAARPLRSSGHPGHRGQSGHQHRPDAHGDRAAGCPGPARRAGEPREGGPRWDPDCPLGRGSPSIRSGAHRPKLEVFRGGTGLVQRPTRVGRRGLHGFGSGHGPAARAVRRMHPLRARSRGDPLRCGAGSS